MPVIEGNYFGQETPRDQIKSLTAAISGWCSNLQDGTSTPEKVCEQINSMIHRIHIVVENNQSLDKWDK